MEYIHLTFYRPIECIQPIDTPKTNYSVMYVFIQWNDDSWCKNIVARLCHELSKLHIDDCYLFSDERNKKKQLRSEHQNGFEFLVLLLHISNNVSPLLLHKHIVKILVLSVVSVIFFLLLSTIDRIFFSPQHHLRYDANKIKTIYVPPVQGV